MKASDVIIMVGYPKQEEDFVIVKFAIINVDLGEVLSTQVLTAMMSKTALEISKTFGHEIKFIGKEPVDIAASKDSGKAKSTGGSKSNTGLILGVVLLVIVLVCVGGLVVCQYKR